MSKKRLVHLGLGLRKELHYEQLKKILHSRKDLRLSQKYAVLKKAFPEECAEEERQRKDRLNQQRWLEMETGSEPPSLSDDFVSDRVLLFRSDAVPTYRKASGSYRVTDFSSWIYDLQGIPIENAALEAGKEAEREVERARTRRRNLIRTLIPQQIGSWRLLYSDLIQGFPDSLEISFLKVDGKPLVGSPDYIFLNEDSGALTILEIKCTDAPLRANGWPNARAQLWAYGNIDEVRNRSSDVSLVCEVWDKFGTGRRQTLRWNPKDDEFERRNRTLFDRWCERLKE